MTRVAINPEILHWACERAGVPIDALIHRFPKFEQWESGEAKPTLRQLEALAKKTLTPLGYFFLDQPPEDRLPIPDFRTVDDLSVHTPSPNLLDTVQMMQRRQAWMRDFLIEQGQPRLAFVGAAEPTEDPVLVADEIRRVLGTGEDWAAQQRTWTDALRALRLAVEEAGILVVINGIVGNNTHRKLDPGEFRGFVLADEYAPLVFVNGADGKAAQMFTLAHELVHVWFDKSAAFDLRELQPAEDRIERACNKVAAEFLVPESELRLLWKNAQREPDPFQVIARNFKVSTLVAARRAMDLALISRDAFFDFYSAYIADERRLTARKRTGGDFYANQDARVGRRFAHAVVRAAKEGRLLYREAYQLTGLRGKTFDKYAKSLGYGGEL
jgi:Zn-dependent peptidase ImmA (M78 family)